MIQLAIWQFILIIVLELIGVAIITFIIVRKLFASQLKKNPPINEK